jgi:hypothetical protein
MSTTHFLVNEGIWQSISDLVNTARHVDAAVAYFGDTGAKLLPLKSGHRLVVDMSLPTVKAGSTDPYEIQKLLDRGVLVFSRRNLHAKLVIADRTVLVGSANISTNSRDNLDEAAVLIKDDWVLKQAQAFFDQLCTEPVRSEYLEACKSAYKPPHTSYHRASGAKSNRRIQHAKLWIVNLIDYATLPESEWDRYEESENKAAEMLKDTSRSSLQSFHWSHKPKMADELETGDWVIQCTRHKDKTITVAPPGQLIWMDQYIRNSKTGKERYVFHLELPKRIQTMDWAVFKQAMESILGEKVSLPRTKPIRDPKKADDLLRLWTPRGRVAKR